MFYRPQPPSPALPYKLETISTDGVKISFTRKRPKATTQTLDGCQPGKNEDDDNDEDDDDDDDEDDLLPLFCEQQPCPPEAQIDVNQVRNGLFRAQAVDFEIPLPAGTPMVGVDPGQANVVTWFEEGKTRQEHQRAATPILGAFGLTTGKYHDLVGHRAHRHRLKLASDELRIPKKDLLEMTFKSADVDLLKQSFHLFIKFAPQLFNIHCSLDLARSRFQVTRNMTRFWSVTLPAALKNRFLPSTVFCFGSAKFRAAQFKGVGSSPYLHFKRVLSTLFRVIDTPEYYTSQK